MFRNGCPVYGTWNRSQICGIEWIVLDFAVPFGRKIMISVKLEHYIRPAPRVLKLLSGWNLDVAVFVECKQKYIEADKEMSWSAEEGSLSSFLYVLEDNWEKLQWRSLYWKTSRVQYVQKY